MRKIFYWKLRNSELALGERTLIAGILNVTPDSFSDGGMFRDPDRAWARALELEQEGADIIDIGAESTRPGAARISADEEWQRLVPVLKRLRGNLRVPLSLDTYKSEIAERAFDYGVEIINDPSGLTFDPSLAKTAAQGNAGLILNHMRGTPETWAKLPPIPDAPGLVARDLEATVNRARRAGVEQHRIAIDPGIGFGKRGEQNAEIIAHLGELARLDLPIMVGPSRKSFLRQKTEDETLFATAAAVTAAILKGAHMVRVHDVRQIRAAVLVADEIARAAAVQRVPLERAAQRAQQRPGRVGMGETGRPARPPLAPPPVNGEVKPVETTFRPETEMRPAAGFERRGERGDARPPFRDRREPRPRPDSGPRDDKRRQGRPEGGPPRFDRGRGDRPPKFVRRDDRPGEGRPREAGPPNGGPRNGRPPQEGRGQEHPPRGRFQGRGDNRPNQQNRPPRGEQPRGEKGRGARPAKRVFRKRP